MNIKNEEEMLLETHKNLIYSHVLKTESKPKNKLSLKINYNKLRKVIFSSLFF